MSYRIFAMHFCICVSLGIVSCMIFNTYHHCYSLHNERYVKNGSGLEVIKLFSCTTQLNVKFQLLIKYKIPTTEEPSCFKSIRCYIYHANGC